MKDNRRSFIKTLGLSSGALMVNQITSLQGKGTDLQEIEKNPEIHVRRKIDTDIVIAGGGMAGVCAAMAFCLTKSLTPATLCADINHMHQLQQILLRQDQALLGVQNEDPDDLARSAAVRASDETIEGGAVNVIDGYNRNIMDEKSHQWQAAMKDDGAWIELAWDRSQNIGIIECTFDTGLHRFLRLSPELSVFRNQIRGPQPETIADYKIELKNKARIVYEKYYTDNYLRKVVHRFPNVEADSIRINVQKTNGDEVVRIYEIRCYQ